MKNSQFLTDSKNNRIEIWSECVNGEMFFWKKLNGLSWDISHRQYLNYQKKAK